VLGLIFLRCADERFAELSAAPRAQDTPADEIDAVDYQAEGVLYLPDEAASAPCWR
jgi:type I restriction enzyme M protein